MALAGKYMGMGPEMELSDLATEMYVNDTSFNDPILMKLVDKTRYGSLSEDELAYVMNHEEMR